MRIFSKFTFICNLCFLVAAAFHYFKVYINNSTYPQPLNFLKGSIVVLGEFAWVINFTFLLAMLILFIMRKTTRVSKSMIIMNAVIFLFQVYYFFIDRT